MASPDTVRGARIRWWERSVRRYFDGEENPDYDASVDNGPFALGTEVSRGENGDGYTVCGVRARLRYNTEDARVVIDLDVTFRFDADTAVDDDFVRDHALPYTIGYLRGAFTDACRSAGLPGLMVPMFDADSAVPVEDQTDE